MLLMARDETVDKALTVKVPLVTVPRLVVEALMV